MNSNDGFINILIEQNPDALIFADTEGMIRVWNTAAERIFGFSKEEAIGSNLDIIIPQNLREAHWNGYGKAIQRGITKYVGKSLPTKALHVDGSVIYVELGFSIILDTENIVIGVLCSARDITTRFIEEKATRKRLSELENTLK